MRSDPRRGQWDSSMVTPQTGTRQTPGHMRLDGIRRPARGSRTAPASDVPAQSIETRNTGRGFGCNATDREPRQREFAVLGDEASIYCSAFNAVTCIALTVRRPAQLIVVGVISTVLQSRRSEFDSLPNMMSRSTNRLSLGRGRRKVDEPQHAGAAS